MLLRATASLVALRAARWLQWVTTACLTGVRSAAAQVRPLHWTAFVAVAS